MFSSPLNLKLWTTELADDPDREFLLDGITHGFQLLPADISLTPAEMHNYSSATNPLSADKVEATIIEEISAGNYVLTDSRPTIVSALGAVPKPDSEDLRLIHDCSMPPGKGVNTYITIEKQRFQTIDHAVKLISNGCFLAKIDLKRAYRSVPVHPSNYAALGLKWKFKGASTFSYLVDTRLPFGDRSAPGIFHRITQAVRRIMAKKGFNLLVVYLDDFLIIGRNRSECKAAFDALSALLVSLGFQLSPSKVVTPCQELVFLGVLLNSVDCTVSLPANKLSALKETVNSFSLRKRASKKQLQQLAGRLNWACKVVYGGRTFLRRVLDLMNTLSSPASRCRLTPEFHRDIDWWCQFLDVFNGKCDLCDTRPITDLETDACSTGMGAYFQGDWFYSHLLVYHPAIAHMHINFKEALCIVFSAMRWCSSWKIKTIHVYCDNTAAVAMLNKGTTSNIVIMKYLRHLFWLSALYNFRLKVYHIPGVENVTADHISRLDDASHILAFMQQIDLQGICSANISAFLHMSESCYYYLLAKFFVIG